MENVDITIIGAGVIGLVVAAELAGKYENIVVLEKNDSFGQESSSRNSEVIHSGIYYPVGSLKARLCVEGARLLYKICQENNIPHRRVGKLIIATEDSELKGLKELFEKGKRNQVVNLILLEKKEIEKLEQRTNAIAAIYSPDTGIIDSHSLMKYFLNLAKAKGVFFTFRSELASIEKENGGFVLGVKEEGYKFKSRLLINCAGLVSDYIAALAGINIETSSYKLKFCKGSYFSYAKPSPIKMLVYPLPDEELVGLGVHATLDLGGQLSFGPDVEYIEGINYEVDPHKREPFFQGASKLIMGLEKEAFIPKQAGIRPKLYGRQEPVRDFVITDEAQKGLAGLINLIGIESPGLTASVAIAKLVGQLVAVYN